MKLENKFTGRGDSKNCQFELVERVGDSALYSRTKDGIKSFEVIKIQTTKKDWIINGKVVSPAGQETYPSTSSWGTLGWSFNSLEKAKDKLEEINNTCTEK